MGRRWCEDGGRWGGCGGEMVGRYRANKAAPSLWTASGRSPTAASAVPAW